MVFETIIFIVDSVFCFANPGDMNIAIKTHKKTNLFLGSNIFICQDINSFKIVFAALESFQGVYNLTLIE